MGNRWDIVLYSIDCIREGLVYVVPAFIWLGGAWGLDQLGHPVAAVSLFVVPMLVLLAAAVGAVLAELRDDNDGS